MRASSAEVKDSSSANCCFSTTVFVIVVEFELEFEFEMVELDSVEERAEVRAGMVLVVLVVLVVVMSRRGPTSSGTSSSVDAKDASGGAEKVCNIYFR